MTAFLKISTWAWIAGVFIVIKCIFKYLAWLYHDKDKPLRDGVRLTWDYLSQHTYFEVARAALQRLYDRLAGIFQKKIRFLYLFLFFLLLNAASLCLGKYFFGIDLAELKALTTSLNELVPPDKQLTIDTMGSAMHPAMAVASVFQLTLLDLSSFLFTMGIIWVACRSRSIGLFLIELMTDISIVLLFLVLIFSLLYFWLLTNFSMGHCGSFLISLFVGLMIWASYFAFRHAGHPNPRKEFFQNPFLTLFYILSLPSCAFLIMFIIGLLYPSLKTATWSGPFFSLTFVFLIPIIIFWSLRIFKWHPQDKVDSVLKYGIIIGLLISLSSAILLLIRYCPLFGKFYELLPSSRNSSFVFILVCSSALPSLAHLLAMAAAIIAKATPKRLQQFINRHLDAITVNDEKVLNQLANGCGVLGALITAIIKLI
ncbi:MAG: hypothetical protein H8D56_10160 [Planctomycetes bacterium]|nr:hypothetical protein [Planctomycetota bacterium]